MKNNPRIYLLDSLKYTPETIAVAFAKTSRSPESFDQIAAELTDQKSAEFNEKWVVGYGHSSVAEHAVLHIAVENVSRLAVENLESNRLASYTEKSTRYQTWPAGAFHTPEELFGSSLYAPYEDLCNRLFAFYTSLIPKVSLVVADSCPHKLEESDNAWKRRVHSTAVDSCRFVLPAASIANVGVTINARALEHAISKMLSSNLVEIRTMGEGIKDVAQKSAPTLLKYAEANPYPANVASYINQVAEIPVTKVEDWCNLVEYTPDLQSRILASVLYRFGQVDYAKSIEALHKMSRDQKEELIKTIFTGHNRFTAPLRELEHSSFSFDVILDQGAWYEVKRHRMMTITTQSFTPNLGFTIPKVVQQAGCIDEYKQLMHECAELYPQLEAVSPGIGSYILPNAFNRRFLISTNLRSVIHFINLRSAVNAHYSVRRLATRMAEQIKQILPDFAPYLFCNIQEDWREIEENNFAVP